MSPNLLNIRRLAWEVKESQTKPLVLVHGGGSYGHPLAYRHKVKQGLKKPNQLHGMSQTHQAMVALNKLIVNEGLAAGLPALGFSPLSMVVTEDGRIRDLYLEPLKRALEEGFMPVLYGDTVIDSEKGFTILSGDQLACRLAEELKASRLILGTDVDGLYSSDPKKDPSSVLLESYSVGSQGVEIGGAAAIDVTGGMKGKLAETLKLLEKGVQVMLVNASKPGRVAKALEGEKVKGTLLTL